MMRLAFGQITPGSIQLTPGSMTNGTAQANGQTKALGAYTVSAEEVGDDMFLAAFRGEKGYAQVTMSFTGSDPDSLTPKNPVYEGEEDRFIKTLSPADKKDLMDDAVILKKAIAEAGL